MELSAEQLSAAGQILRTGGIVCFPTETFYGLGANPTDEGAVNKLLELKDRELKSGVPLIIADPNHVSQWIADEQPEIRNQRIRLQQQFWPGPLTIVIAVRGSESSLQPGIFGPDRSLALRVSSHEISRALAVKAGGAITATSANPRAQPPAENADQAHSYFPDLHVVGSNCAGSSSSRPRTNAPSTILDVRLSPFRIIREGAISATELSAYL